MARKPREKSSSGIYHIILRGINRQSIFEDEEDRLRLLEVLRRGKEISHCRIFAYCFMDNHVHLLLQEVQEPISVIMQRLSSSYVIWYNGKHDRCGHLFQERFGSEAVETDSYFLTVLRYIHQNPVKTNLVAAVGDYKWSSYQEYTSNPNIVDTYFALKMFSDKPQEALRQFIDFTNAANVDVCLDIQESKVKISDEELRQVIRQQFGMQTIKICQESRDKQDEILRLLKAIDSASIRQIARITGLSTTRVWKA